MKLNAILKMGAAMMVLALMIFVVQSFGKKNKESVPQTYYYVSSDLSEGAFGSAVHWETVDPGDCEADGERPCKITVPSGQTINSVLSGKDNETVLGMSNGRRP